MKGKFLAAAAASILTISSFAGLSSYAATIDELEAKARAYGIPESAIQQGINQYYQDPDSVDLDFAMEYLDGYHDAILEYLGVPKPSPTTEPGTDKSEKTEPTTKQNTTEKTTEITSSGEKTTESPTAVSTNTPEKPSQPNYSGGTLSFERVDPHEFINMSLDQKQSYVSSLTDEQREQFLASLNAEELKSIVKQLPTDNKVAVVDKFVQASEALGVNVTINEITDNNISFDVFNNDGELTDKGSIGVIVENTGLDYSLLYLIAGSCLAASIAGIWLVYRKFFSDKKAGMD